MGWSRVSRRGGGEGYRLELTTTAVKPSHLGNNLPTRHPLTLLSR